MNDYEEYLPKFVAYETYDKNIQEKNVEINDLQEELKKSNDQLEESKEVINILKGEIKRYERIITKNHISLDSN